MHVHHASRFFPAACAIAASLSAASGGVSQSTITPPGGFMQAGAYSHTTGGITPGHDLGASVGIPEDFHEQVFSGLSSAQASAAYTLNPVSNSAHGVAGMGYSRFFAFNSSPDSTPFSLGIVNGGWTEGLTVHAPGLAGQAGYLTFRVRARGTMHTTGRVGNVKLEVMGYKDRSPLTVNPWYDRGTSDPSGGTSQWIVWALTSPGTTTPLDRTVDGAATFSVPIVFGQPFTLGLYADARAGQRSSGASPSISSGTIDFSAGGVAWDGVTAIRTASGAIVSAYTIDSASGADWYGPLGACVADLTGDSILDFSDYLEFLNRFQAADLSVDFTGDGLVDFSDYLEFLGLYDQGC